MDKQEYQKRLGRLLDKHWALITGQAPIYEHATTEETLQAICLLNEEAISDQQVPTTPDAMALAIIRNKLRQELKQIIGVSNE